MTQPNKYPFATKVLFTEKMIHDRIAELAKQIKVDYMPYNISYDKPLVLVGVLKGAYTFCSDLARALADAGVPNTVEFICVSSYGSNTESCGEVRMLLDLRHSIIGKHCLIVEDIVDSGRTLLFLQRVFSTRSPASLKMITLLDKPARQVQLDVDYKAFDMPKEFVVGYGLDYAERFRELRDIAVLSPDVYTASNGLSKL
jgi:hypoxanthine phosphoribosyltransferase